ncbi:sperm-associated acrosin inhibitor-like [Choloepus didactylus]|uniref:sperm-associated acrosin inhibitor-like n=1 Tax=Choloepus didactylus TaxID=27675 RepID=UPI00189E6099|nr:sperm-associated acrosin inhibitor-like [Choloepus didactylus]
MPFFTSWNKAIVIILLAFPLYSAKFSKQNVKHNDPSKIKEVLHHYCTKPNCTLFKDVVIVCTAIWDPVCATNSQTYINECTFCKDVIFIYVLITETSFLPSRERVEPPNCFVYIDHLNACKNIKDPVCATNGQTYNNGCIFCSKMIESGGAFEFDHYGICES